MTIRISFIKIFFFVFICRIVLEVGFLNAYIKIDNKRRKKKHVVLNMFVWYVLSLVLLQLVAYIKFSTTLTYKHITANCKLFNMHRCGTYFADY